MSAGKRLRRHMGRVEYLACKETVDAMLAQGFSKKLIHERLTEEGRFSMAYISFCQIIRNADKKTAPVESPQTLPAPVRQQRVPGIIKAGPEPMQDPRTVDPKNIF